jgi:ribosomal protein L16/L10AE
MAGGNTELMKEAMIRAAAKLPIKTKIVERQRA